MSFRVIPRLDIKGPNLVKGVRLEGLRVLGKPERFARQYYESGADELIYLDVVASLYGRNSLLDIVSRTSREIFIPLTVGGGIRSLEDIRRALRAGADKVAINTAAIRTPTLITEAAEMFGSSTIVVSIEAKARSNGRYEAYTDNGREPTGVDVFQWAVRAEQLGAGEILLTSIDREGTGSGLDLPLIRRVAESVQIPVIASGGAGQLDHIRAAAIEGKADAVAVASLLHYQVVRSGSFGADTFEEGNVDFLRGRSGDHGIAEDVTLTEIKRDLAAQGVECRPDTSESLGI
jgi:cyclase